MLLKLIRNTPQSKALLGQLYVDGAYFCDTLEHTNYAIPDGCYRLRMTYSPHFKEVLPILDHVFGYYSGGSEWCRIVFHRKYNATQCYTTAKQCYTTAKQLYTTAKQCYTKRTPHRYPHPCGQYDSAHHGVYFDRYPTPNPPL